MTSILSPEERDELAAMIDEVAAIAKGTGDRAELLHRRLLDAEQAHQPMATEVIYTATLDGLSRVVTSHIRKRSIVLVDIDGVKASKSLVGGLRHKREDGTDEYQQTFYIDMTWDQVEQHVTDILVQLGALSLRRDLLRRLLSLREQVPESRTPGEAVKQLGTTLEAWMEAA